MWVYNNWLEERGWVCVCEGGDRGNVPLVTCVICRYCITPSPSPLPLPGFSKTKIARGSRERSGTVWNSRRDRTFSISTTAPDRSDRFRLSANIDELTFGNVPYPGIGRSNLTKQRVPFIHHLEQEGDY